jgi:hypothetical protein
MLRPQSVGVVAAAGDERLGEFTSGLESVRGCLGRVVAGGELRDTVSWLI